MIVSRVVGIIGVCLQIYVVVIGVCVFIYMYNCVFTGVVDIGVYLPVWLLQVYVCVCIPV